MGPFLLSPFLPRPPALPLRALRSHSYATGKDLFGPTARQLVLVQEENRGHLYHFGNLGVLSSVFIRDLDGITVQWRSEGAGGNPRAQG